MEQAAALGSPQGIYNISYREGENKNYPRAVELFKEALEMDPTYWNAQLELARFYIEGWGVEQDLDKAIQMLEEVIQKSDDPHYIQVAKANMAIAKDRKG